MPPVLADREALLLLRIGQWHSCCLAHKLIPNFVNRLMLSILLGVPISIFLWQRQSPKQGQEDSQSSRDHDKVSQCT